MDWLLQNARTRHRDQPVDVYITAGRITAIGPNLSAESTFPGAQSWDLQGRVLLPGLVDAHTHLDKTYTTIENRSGTLSEAIEMWRRIMPGRTCDDVHATASKAIYNAIANGVTSMRSHVDIGDSRNLVALEALNALRAETRDMIDLQLVALGTCAGSPQHREAMEGAVRQGADMIGGAPSLRSDPESEIDAALNLAEQYSKPVDLHIDETEDPSMLALEYLAEQTLKRGMQGLVTAGHCCSLAFVDADTVARILDKVAAAQINIVTLPSCNLVLMGRNRHPAPRGITPVAQLLARGINVCAASDNVHDPFNPFGSYDLLQIASLTAHVAHMTAESELLTCLDMVTTRAASTLGFNGYGLEVGKQADLVVIDTDSVLNAVVSPPPRIATFKAGKLIVQTDIIRTWQQPERIPQL